MTKRTTQVPLEKIAKEKLSRQIIKDIDTIELEVWEKSNTGLSLNIGKGAIELRLNYKIATKKFLTWLGGITAAITAVITVLKWLMPILISYYAHSPP